MSRTVTELAAAQLDAYNRADVDAFCLCHSDDVRVLDETGAATIEGAPAFRARYASLFAEHRDVRAEVLVRLPLGRHCVDHERWSRVHRATGVSTSGEVLVRYTERDGRIAIVELLR